MPKPNSTTPETITPGRPRTESSRTPPVSTPPEANEDLYPQGQRLWTLTTSGAPLFVRYVGPSSEPGHHEVDSPSHGCFILRRSDELFESAADLPEGEGCPA